jgi:regulator of G-protein signaling
VQVSLDARVRDLINQRITKPTPDIFKEAQAQIFILMQRDSYPRFVTSPIFLKVAHYKYKKTKLKKQNSTKK